MKNIVLKFTFILMICSPAFGADENIDMLNRLGKEINVDYVIVCQIMAVGVLCSGNV